MADGTDDRTTPAKGLPRVYHTRGGNPAGQPKKLRAQLREELAGPITDLTRQAMGEKLGGVRLEDVPQFDNVQSGLVWLIIQLALRADFEAIREITDRLDPKPRRMEVSGPGGGPIRQRINDGPLSAEDIASGAAYFAALPGIDPDEEGE